MLSVSHVGLRAVKRSALLNRHHGAACLAVKLYAEVDKRTVACNSFRTIESE
ncbi:hypothetical protein BCAR13_1300018 [Paraburkholderia caribensis]|nr:hypothetical protein BCAR13_1300018 [Paraburkholderia caribensis]